MHTRSTVVKLQKSRITEVRVTRPSTEGYVTTVSYLHKQTILIERLGKQLLNNKSPKISPNATNNALVTYYRSILLQNK